MNKNIKEIKDLLYLIYSSERSHSVNQAAAETAWRALNAFLNELNTLYLDTTDPLPSYEDEIEAAVKQAKCEIGDQLLGLLDGTQSLQSGAYLTYIDKIKDYKKDVP